jgi:hypothetical protein
MWGLSFRSIGGAGAGFLFGSILAWIVPMMLPFIQVDGAENDIVVEAFTAIGANAITILILSVLVGFVAGAVREATF